MYKKLTELFLDWNSKINLSAIRDKKWVEIKHIQDSLVGLKVIEKLVPMLSWTWFRISDWKLKDSGSSLKWQNDINSKWQSSQFSALSSQLSIVDVWTWSWFPVLPLAIEKPGWKFVWIESVRKKVDAVNDIIEKLGLKNIKIIWTRAEDYKDQKFDILTARAVAYIDKLLKFTKHLVKKWWYFVLYKLDSEQEYKDILKNCKKYNLELVLKHSYTLFAGDIKRMIYVLRKK